MLGDVAGPVSGERVADAVPEHDRVERLVIARQRNRLERQRRACVLRLQVGQGLVAPVVGCRVGQRRANEDERQEPLTARGKLS